MPSRLSHPWRVLPACAVLAAACTAPPPAANTATRGPADSATKPAAEASATLTPTAAAVARGRELFALWKSAAGGEAVTALRSVEISGTSVMTGIKATRQLSIAARFPLAFRIEETPPTKVGGLHLAMGLTGDTGWIAGASLLGDGSSPDPAAARRAYTRAVRQTMAGVMAGVNLSWLADTGKYTFTDGGVVDSGADQDALQLLIDGPDGRVGRLLLDPKTHLPRRLVEPPVPGGGGTAALADITYSYGDYITQGNVHVPTKIVRTNASAVTTWTLARFRLNPQIPATRFARR